MSLKITLLVNAPNWREKYLEGTGILEAIREAAVGGGVHLRPIDPG